MYKKNKKDYSRYKIDETLCELSKGESNWGKYLVRASFEDNTSTIDIRRLKIVENDDPIIGKGISLTPEETDKLTNSLIQNGFGSTDVLKEEINRRNKMYGGDDENAI